MADLEQVAQEVTKEVAKEEGREEKDSGQTVGQSSESGEQTLEAAATAAEKPEQKSAPKPPDFKGTKHKVRKEGGSEEEVEYDELVRGYSHAKVANERMRQAAEMRKDVDKFVEDPWAYLHQKGKDPYELAEKLLLQKLKFEQLSPEQKALAKTEMEKAQLEREIAEHRRVKEAEELKTIEAEEVKRLDDEFELALNDLKIQGKSAPRLVMEAALNMLARHHTGGKLAAKDAIVEAQKNIKIAAQEWLNNLSLDDARTILPKRLVEGLRKDDVERVASQDPWKAPKRKDNANQPAPARKKPLSTDEYFSRLESKFTS